MNRVCVVGADWGIMDMYLRRGWKLADNVLDCDLVQFTGGEDVTPAYYKEEAHPHTRNNPKRDDQEYRLFAQIVQEKVPMTGICRGGQFLNVASGGRMWQHVNNHAIYNTHPAMFGTEVVPVTSTHHQMIRPEGMYELVGTASQSTYRETATVVNDEEGFVDVESVFYPHTMSLCFQPHPEYVEIDHPCQDLYFNLLEHYFGLR